MHICGAPSIVEEGVKDRPCATILSAMSDNGEEVVTVLKLLQTRMKTKFSIMRQRRGSEHIVF